MTITLLADNNTLIDKYYRGEPAFSACMNLYKGGSYEA